MDNLARDCAMALQAGMSYGQWKALHPYTKWETEQPSVEARPCHWCGNPLPESSQHSRKYCCEKCKEAADRARVRDRHRQKMGLQEVDYKVKLTKEDVVAARRERRTKGTPLQTLADRYGVALRTMCSALSGESWRDVPFG
jgi:predicted nucleic acid-binding Zn ribbon protein